MNKTILFFAILFSFHFAHAQKFYVGIKGGVNSSTLTGNDTVRFDKKQLPGFHIGLLANIGVSDVLSLQPEITYSRQGLAVIFKNDPNLDRGKAYINYINVTLLAKAMFGGESIRFFLNAGPYAGYIISGKNVFKYKFFGITVEDKYDFVSKGRGDDLKRLDLGATVGIGATFRAGPGDVVADLRYSLGLGSVSENPLFQKYANSVFSISLGYVIPLGDFY